MNIDPLTIAGFELEHSQTLGKFRFAISPARRTLVMLTCVSQWLLYSSLGAGVIADCLIAISLCVWLLRIRTGFKRYKFLATVSEVVYSRSQCRTDSLLNVLMLYSINTGMVTRYVSIQQSIPRLFFQTSLPAFAQLSVLLQWVSTKYEGRLEGWWTRNYSTQLHLTDSIM